MDASTYTHDFWRSKASSLKFRTQHFIDGQYVASADGRTFPSINPATGSTITEVARGGQAEINRAVAVARKAFKSGSWSRMDPRSRMAVLEKFSALVESNAEEFAVLDSLDMGKPVMDMMNIDIPGSVMSLKFFAETIDKIEGAVTSTASSALHYILRQPLGVVGLIVPWNYPLMMAAWKLGPALATGNSVVLKPAEQSPLSANLLAELFIEAGGPPGVFNVVHGLGEEAGKALALHNDVDKIGFTGSTEVGKLLMIYAGQSNMKRVSTECGGKTPQIILEDYDDLDTAVTYAVNGIYGNQGEVCNAGSRILVQKSIHDDFVDRFVARTQQNFVLGDPLDPSTTIGPLVTSSHQKRVLNYIDIGRKEGASLKFGGGTFAGAPSGAYVEPTLFTGVNNTMQIAREEIFGPVAAVIPVDGVDQAIEIANDSIYGLAASIWTRDIAKAHNFARDIEAGVVWVNCFDHGDMTSIWGGFKQTGNGRDKCLEALTQYTQTKSVWVNLA
ncbi:gamma-glutamyl-gamma-aminobutyraldehyde dehydrogenase [Mycoplana sp. BE70]|uniref:aldehyde dehydrogenase n=1 Tax=Mycoplana sp. BE70 TaxID=2817775 RepID=UPI00286181A7|nr:aldehyde dehydrogenase [Mycoplana sp. BE70]MDR6759145.1 gamma-glutamyl-gamma-aminobutyraldehyde dehydrogenase [Mycoplana sp. BE70]